MNKNEAVIMKSNRYGIQLHLDPDMEFEALSQKILEKFQESERFFRDASFAISFEGRELSEDEENAIVTMINEKTTTHVICIVAEDEIREAILKQKTESALMQDDPPVDPFRANEAEVRFGDVTEGEMLIVEQNLLIYGNVEKGATVTSRGSVTVLGTLAGNVWAGSDNREDSFVFALHLMPESLRIGSVVFAKEEGEPGFFTALKQKKKKSMPEIARNEHGMVSIKPYEHE